MTILGFNRTNKTGKQPPCITLRDYADIHDLDLDKFKKYISESNLEPVCKLHVKSQSRQAINHFKIVDLNKWRSDNKEKVDRIKVI